MDAKKIRRQFIKFFHKQKNFPHTIVHSSSLIPANDTSVLFTTAGMQQFKPYFINNAIQAKKDFGSTTLTSAQKCFRVSDIDEVGDASHLTFFEMLGNFSLGSYYKKEAIEFAWKFCTEKLRLNPEHIWVTYFQGNTELMLNEDIETKNIWIKTGVSAKHIVPRGMEDNFWGPPGSNGPCGPSTEMYYPLNESVTIFSEKKLLEIWNIVLMEYEKSAKSGYKLLKQKNIDTGMGLERIAMICEKVQSVFETSLFAKLRNVLIHDDQFGYDPRDERRLRIALDHLRATVFLLSEGITFGKKEQQAIVRRIFRKALDQYEKQHPSFNKIVHAIIDIYSSEYPEIKTSPDSIIAHMVAEQQMYLEVRARKVESYITKIRKHDVVESQFEPLQGFTPRSLEAEEAFQLYTTYGFSLEHIQQEGYEFDMAAVLKKIENHKARSKEGADKKFGGHGLDTIHSGAVPVKERILITRLHTATHLLHSTLRSLLGESVSQQGSDINPERLRFDFTFDRKLTDDEKKEIEERINTIIQKDYVVIREEMDLDEALAKGALAFFREKYPNKVSVYSIKDPKSNEIFSMELCGGPHVSHTSEIGIFRITSEKSVAKGIRRIKATVGSPALDIK